MKTIGRCKKIRNMKYCLAEGARVVMRRFLKTCISISIMQDGRKSALVIRYRASDKMLKIRSGALGQICVGKEFQDLSSLSVAHGTMKAIKNFCTANLRPPGLSSGALGSRGLVLGRRGL